MQTLRSYILVLLVCISFVDILSQTGVPYISYIETKEHFEAANWSICQDDHNAMLFANKKGLLRYDGNEWSTIPLPYIPVAIKKNPYNHVVYIVSENDYGYLKRDAFGLETYTPLTYAGELTEHLSDIYFTDSTIIIYSENLISIHRSSDEVLLARYKSSEYAEFSGLIILPQELLVNVKGLGLHKIEGDSLIAANRENFSGEKILFSLPYDNNTALIGCASGALHLFDGKKDRPFLISNPDYLTENILSSALLINDSCYAFSTLYGGVVIVQKQDGKVRFTLNYETGIPDDEIFAMATDSNNGLWLSYEYGTCRVDLELPVKDFSHYPGIEGLITNTCWYNNELYIATSEGLYYLSEVKNYEEVDVYFKKKLEAEPEKESRKKRRTAQNEENLSSDTERSGFLRKIFSRSKNDAAADGEASINSTVPSQQPEEQYYSKKVSKLKSIDYVYKKVSGINSRSEKLLTTPFGLLVGSSSGLYFVWDHSAKLLQDARNVNYIGREKEGEHYTICADEGVFYFRENDGEWIVEKEENWEDGPAFSVYEEAGIKWISSYNMLSSVKNIEGDSVSVRKYSFKSVYPEELFLYHAKDTLFLFSNSKIRYYSDSADSFKEYSMPGFNHVDYSTMQFFSSGADKLWIKHANNIESFGKNGSVSAASRIWGLFDNITGFYSDVESACILVDDYSKILLIEKKDIAQDTGDFKMFINYITNEEAQLFNPSNLVFEPKENRIRIGVTAPYFLKNKSTLYQHKIEGRMENWSKWSSSSEFEFYPEPGEYTIHIRAKNILEELSNPISISYIVKTPFYRTTVFYLLFIPILLSIFFLIIYVREKKLKRDKRILEERVQERTIEIQNQKQKIEIQKDEILAQKNDITSSITYASRIQHAILPARKIFEKSFSEYFIFYRPRDIVSGDFYWIAETHGSVIFAAADCTGHGVPGAFMSMLGNSFLNEITKNNMPATSSGEILDQLREKITDALSQSGENLEAQDGMDIALCVYKKKEGIIEYSGAYNSLFLIRDGHLTELKADRMPIGYFPRKKNFKTQILEVKKNDIIYLFSDGFPDQFGGPKGKKYTSQRFKQMLTDAWKIPLFEQQDHLQQELDAWQTFYDQVDDILVLGVKI